MKTIFLYFRLALADSLLFVALVLGCTFGFAALLFGFPKELFTDSREIVECVESYFWIVLVVAVVMFFAEWSKKKS